MSSRFADTHWGQQEVGAAHLENHICVCCWVPQGHHDLAWDKRWAPGKGVPRAPAVWGCRLLTMHVVMLWLWVALLGLLRWPGHRVWLPCLLLPNGASGPGLARLSCLHQGRSPGQCTQDCVSVCDLFCFPYSPRCLVCSRKFFQTILAAPVDANNGGNLLPP